ncbi:PAS domain-containing sensor histidine kinase [Leptospira congkakensis]|uniref:histidine kinase n=1 Tax=Leptospira congkakensis TaxID=2484932 RepID=A0A4Z1A728_9LEPT|nr:HAMP domain-containing sensor histidine kinase [Leptospira congkakensis]TGL86719.1 PAS domain-containing sensor histidine kinase [Leptospira congkakensis]TGL93736.1 PAS domain-containing sensor histidine kinase [Leptospira congkakensis]TGL94858.1 PAS domain-containing sensor histidine kinase [Leptospira congkakensis]
MSTLPKTYEALLADLKRLEEENQMLKQSHGNKNLDHSSLINALQFTQFSIDTISDAIVWTDEDGNYVFVNDAACRNYGYTKEELLSMQMFQVDPLFTVEMWKAHWQEILERKSFSIETINRTKDGTSFPIEVTVNLVEYGGKKYNCGIIRNITERKLAENNLKQSAIRLAELNSTKDKFFSIIAHDLRGPLGTQKEFTKILSEKDSSFTDSERTSYLKMLEESSDLVYSLLENLLDWARSQTGAIQFQPISLPFYDLVQRVIGLLSLSANKKSVAIHNKIPKDLEIFADPFMIETVIRNLISNAIKYSLEGKQVTIGVLPSEQIPEPKENSKPKMVSSFKTKIDPNATIFFVKDTGVGMKEEQIQNLFRLDRKTSTLGTNQETGTGLGLILCKEFLEKHKSTLWVETEIDVGSTFFFQLVQNTKTI